MISDRDKEAFKILVEAAKANDLVLLEAKDLQGKQVSVVGIINPDQPDGFVGIVPVAMLTPADLTEMIQPPEGAEVRDLREDVANGTY